jgi:hypothetical protein
VRYEFFEDAVAPAQQPARTTPSYAGQLRRELSARNLEWAAQQKLAHVRSTGSIPPVLYRTDEGGRHGNFHPQSWRQIQANPAWASRLNKTHTTARRILVSYEAGGSELDSCNSSDALLMNIFCHPAALAPGGALRTLLGIEADSRPQFGYHPRIPMLRDRLDTTEVDLRWGHVLVEAKLTEADFQTAPARLAERYRDFAEVFAVDSLPRAGDRYASYQLLRGALAAWHQPEARFGVVCDARRPDLVAAWYGVLQAVRPVDLRCRLFLLTWQEVAACCAPALRRWLGAKYGIIAN